MVTISQSPTDLVPGYKTSLDSDVTILLGVVGVFGLVFAAYLVFDHFMARRRARRYEARRGRRPE